jgi:hypothetical protein
MADVGWWMGCDGWHGTGPMRSAGKRDSAFGYNWAQTRQEQKIVSTAKPNVVLLIRSRHTHTPLSLPKKPSGGSEPWTPAVSLKGETSRIPAPQREACLRTRLGSDHMYQAARWMQAGLNIEGQIALSRNGQRPIYKSSFSPHRCLLACMQIGLLPF